MNTFKVLLTVLLSLAGISLTQAQNLTSNKIKSAPWIVGAGFNALDVSQNFHRQLLPVKPYWKIMPFPSRFTVEKQLINGISINLNASFNKYNENRILGDKEHEVGMAYTSLNIIAKYDLNKLLGSTRWIDPYLLAGLGNTVRNQEIKSQSIRQDFQTTNIGAGLNLWLTGKCGFNLETVSRFSFYDGARQKQHAFGVIYKLKR